MRSLLTCVMIMSTNVVDKIKQWIKIILNDMVVKEKKTR